MRSVFTFAPSFPCTYIKVDLLFSKEKTKRGSRRGYYSHRPYNQFNSFQKCLSKRKEKKKKSKISILSFFHFNLWMFPAFSSSVRSQICAGKYKTDKKRHKVEFWVDVFLFFFRSIIFPRKSFFSQYKKEKKDQKKNLCIELVNIQKILFFIST